MPPKHPYETGEASVRGADSRSAVDAVYWGLLSVSTRILTCGILNPPATRRNEL